LYNKAAVELWGNSPELGKSEFCGSWKLYWPDGTPLPHADARWQWRCADDGDHFILTWSESGGPPVDRQTDGAGFGTLLARATVSGQLGGEISRDWKPEGLSIRPMVARNSLSVQRSED
jgi:hypothetical protein